MQDELISWQGPHGKDTQSLDAGHVRGRDAEGDPASPTASSFHPAMMPPVEATTPGFDVPARSLTLGTRTSVKICRSIASNIQAAQADAKAPQAANDSDRLGAATPRNSPAWPNMLMAVSRIGPIERSIPADVTWAHAKALGQERTKIWTKAPRFGKLGVQCHRCRIWAEGS